MASSLTKVRCFFHYSTSQHLIRLNTHNLQRRHGAREIRCIVGGVSSYHTGVVRREGCSANGGSRRLAGLHLNTVLLTPPHITPSHRHLSSFSNAFSKVFSVSAESPQEPEMIASPPLDSTIIDTTAQITSSTIETESIVYIPPPPVPPEDLGPALNALGEPTLQSLGVAGWSPVGIIQSCLENIHVFTGLPWWATIAIATVILRSTIFPLVIMSQRNAAKMNNNLPQLSILQMKMTEARNTGDQMNSSRYAQELMQFMKEKELSPFRNVIVPLAQAPIFISMFMALRGLANLPVESFKDGGMMWFTDLTICDPYYALPVITSLTMLATIELGTDGARLSSQNMHLMKYVLRALPLLMFPFTMNFPTAVLCYWVSTNLFSLIQVGFLRIPSIREYFKIEQMIDHKKETLPPQKGFTEGLQESWKNMKISREIAERANYDEIRFRKAGTGPVIRTYKYDPTKVVNVQAKVKDTK